MRPESLIFDGDNVADATTANAQHTYAEDGSHPARLTVSDGEASTSVTVKVIVANVAPTLGAIVARSIPRRWAH